jgi:hypothetical protein
VHVPRLIQQQNEIFTRSLGVWCRLATIRLPNGFVKVKRWTDLLAGDGERVPEPNYATVTTFHVLRAERTATFCPLLDNSGQKWILARDGLSAYAP